MSDASLVVDIDVRLCLLLPFAYSFLYLICNPFPILIYNNIGPLQYQMESWKSTNP
jgi:hypothetical protein